MAGENLFIHLENDVYIGHVVKKTRFTEHDRDQTRFAFQIAETLQISATEAAIMLTRLDLAGLEIRPKADRI